MSVFVAPAVAVAAGSAAPTVAIAIAIAVCVCVSHPMSPRNYFATMFYSFSVTQIIPGFRLFYLCAGVELLFGCLLCLALRVLVMNAGPQSSCKQQFVFPILATAFC